jgi:23S rRNA (uracil1939-C5)-methyltransferase
MNKVMNELSTLNCAHFGACSGCTLAKEMHNPPIWEEVKNFFPMPVDLETGLMRGWRVKAKLAIRGTTQNPQIGLYLAGSHCVSAIPSCRAHHPAINRAVSLLAEAIQKEKISIYDEAKGLLRYAQFFVELKTGKVQLVLVTTNKDGSLHRLANRLLQMESWHSIWFNVQPALSNQIFGQEWIHFSGDLYLQQEISGAPFLFHPAAFAQAHWTLFERLAWDVVDQVPSGAHLIELYAGIGVMGRLAASKCQSVQLVENNPFSHQSFRAISSSISYHLEDASESLGRLRTADCVLVDPPRKGVDPTLLQALGKWDGKLIYVSCDFKSFERDTEQLIEQGWKLVHGKGYLLFPGTNHVEIVASLEK